MRPDGSVCSRAHNATSFKPGVAMRDVQGGVWRVSDVVWRSRSELAEQADAGGWRGQERARHESGPSLPVTGWHRFETPPASKLALRRVTSSSRTPRHACAPCSRIAAQHAKSFCGRRRSLKPFPRGWAWIVLAVREQHAPTRPSSLDAHYGAAFWDSTPVVRDPTPDLAPPRAQAGGQPEPAAVHPVY
jgi:hypothetical protein